MDDIPSHPIGAVPKHPGQRRIVPGPKSKAMFEEEGGVARKRVVTPHTKEEKDSNGVQLREIETPGKGGRAGGRRTTLLTQGLELSAWKGRVIEGRHLRHRARDPLEILAVGHFSGMRRRMSPIDGN